MMKSWKKECSATTLLSQVFGAKLLGEAETLMQESDWCDLICEPPYRRKGVYRCKNPKASQKLDWKPIGIVGEIYIDDDVFSRCIVRREESQQFDPESILSYHSSEAIDNMFYWYIKNGYGVLSDKVPNTGLYVKMKLDGSKLQIISDRSNANKADEIRPRSFKLFSPEDMKCIMRKRVDLWFFSFDISNFFHSFVVSKLMRVLCPTLYRWARQNGSCVTVEALRLVFGSSFSPIVSHGTACKLLGIPDTIYDKSFEEHLKVLIKRDIDLDSLFGMYIDDFIFAATSLEKAGVDYHKFKQKFLDANCGIKESSIKEAVRKIEYAGKVYCGKAACTMIGNSEKNKRKVMAHILSCVKNGLTKDKVESLIGSIAYLGVATAWCLPYLSRCRLWVDNKLQTSEDSIIEDLVSAMTFACIPWSPMCQIRWFNGQSEVKKLIFVDAQNLFGRFGLIWWNGSVWMERSVKIPKKFCDSQQTAELFALKKAIGFGLNVIGQEITVISDSASSLFSITKFKMASHCFRRNQILRKLASELVLRNATIWLLWVASDLNPADQGSRVSSDYPLLEREFSGDVENVFIKGLCIGRTDYLNRVGSRKTEGFDS
mmetsp:Transcript_43015/g.60327  ORF Transcript_43015/g.60327 Transcript_43015/m.60327 type:complete len:601 (+) Transcript_43015:735-2537(+)